MCRAKETPTEWSKWSKWTCRLNSNYRIYLPFKISAAKFLNQAKTEFNSLLALMEMRIDKTTAESLAHIVGQHLPECCGYRFTLGCSANGITIEAGANHIATSDLEDPPSRQLAYSLTTTLIRISTALPSFEKQAEAVFLDHLEKVGGAFLNALAHQGL